MNTLAPTNLQFRVGGWQEKILMRQRKLIFLWFLGNEIATESTTRNSFSILIKKESRIAINAD